jgi:ABC-type nitrate/sulfonate/bicarbonate transport system ATPase subunit
MTLSTHSEIGALPRWTREAMQTLAPVHPAPNGLRATSIGFSYRNAKQATEIFRDVTIEVRRGATLALFGPNGTGKTTLMRALAGLQPVTGKIALTRRAGERGSSAIGYVPQGFARSFYPWASLETNILLSLPNHCVGRAAAARPFATRTTPLGSISIFTAGRPSAAAECCSRRH